MHVINASNVRDALPKAVEYIMRHGAREKTRFGQAFVAPGPVTIMYHNPKQHVLLNKVRDANPFFHLMEAMWMLAGKQNGEFLDHYVKDFSKRFGHNGIITDAYGYRWRHGLFFDQLDEIIAQLGLNTSTRQCVLQMWGAKEGTHDLLSSLAKPCNLVATFRVTDNKLDMTVFNRSNDLIWGCCGANAVHFPILQEYIAGMLGIGIGSYWQISTNLHLYIDHIRMIGERLGKYDDRTLAGFLHDKFEYESTEPLISSPSTFDKELYETMEWIDDIHQNKKVYLGNIANKFLCDVVVPMAMSHQCYKNNDRIGAHQAMELVIADDWRNAGQQWLDRRYYERNRRQVNSA